MEKSMRLGIAALVVGVLAAVGLSMVVLYYAHPAEATFPGKNGRIAYVSLTQNREADIYTVNPDGIGKFRVTNTKNTTEQSPDYSPNGKKIAYAGWNRNYVSHIYIISATGGKPFQVTNTRFGEGGPIYSPNGKKIAYMDNRQEYPGGGLHTISLRGGGKSRVTEGADPSWGSCP